MPPTVIVLPGVEDEHAHVGLAVPRDLDEPWIAPRGTTLRQLLGRAEEEMLLLVAPGASLSSDAIAAAIALLRREPSWASLSLVERDTGRDPARPVVLGPGDPVLGSGRVCALVRRSSLAIGSRHVPGALDGDDLVASIERALSLPGLVRCSSVAPVTGAGATGLPVLLDGRCFAMPMSGTQVQVLHLAEALAERASLELTVLLPSRPHPSTAPSLTRLRHRSRTTTSPGVRQASPVLHRPHQLFFPWELRECLDLADRFVLTQQDMIACRTPAYSPSDADWRVTVTLTELAFLAADRVGFFSDHARRDALSGGVLRPEKTAVAPLGLEHLAREPSEDRRRPSSLPERGGMGRLLLIGNAYRHKNRLLALEILEMLLRRGWTGELVLAGGHPPVGSSGEAETAWLAARPTVRDHVFELGSVTDAEKRWLYANSDLVLYPTLYEGFGFVPFEAAAFGTPCLYTSRTSLGEFLPSEGALLDPLEPEPAATAVLDVLESPARADTIVSAVDRAARPLTWARTAAIYEGLYRDAAQGAAGLAGLVGNRFVLDESARVAANDDEEAVLRLYRRSVVGQTGVRLARRALGVARSAAGRLEPAITRYRGEPGRGGTRR